MNRDKGPTTFDHIGLATRDLFAPMRFFCGVLGGRPYAGGPSAGFLGAQWEFLHGERLEAITPAGPPGGFLHRFLQKSGPGVHHVTFKVPDIHSAAAAAEKSGYDVVALDDSNPGWKEAFLHPKQALGIVVQFAESHPDLDSGWGADFEFPAVPLAATPPTAQIVGLRLSADDETAVRNLWCDLAGGQSTRNDGEYFFTWPDSRMRIAVSLRSDRRPGPLAIELASPPSSLDLEKPVAGIGCRFVSSPTNGTEHSPAG